MLKQVHLQNSLLRGHRCHFEPFYLADRNGILYLGGVDIRKKLLLYVNFLFQTGAVLSYLAFYIFHCGIQGTFIIFIGYLRPEYRAVAVDGKFDTFPNLIAAHGNRCLGFRREELVELGKLLFYPRAYVVGEGELLCNNSNRQSSISFRILTALCLLL